MKKKEILDSTINRGEFNRAYKAYLENKGKIRCSYCKYHDNENRDSKFYGNLRCIGENILPRNPSWKLTSKNPKQWMDKGVKLKIETKIRRYDRDRFEWLEYVF